MKEKIQMDIVQTAQKILTNSSYLDNAELLVVELRKLYEDALVLNFLEKNMPETLKNPSPTFSEGWADIKAHAPEKEVFFEQKTVEKPISEPKKSLNDQVASKQLQIGLNDRIAFVAHLFDGNIDEYNKAIGMINNLHTPDECWDFILNKVKPSYNNWQGKEEYEDRFFYIVSKRFG